MIDENAKHRRLLAAATREIEALGLRPTIARLAEHLDLSDRTVRRWQKVAG